MSQTVLTVIIEVQPESANRLIQLISDFDAQQEPVSADEKKFDKLRSAVPSLHFLSMTVFPDDQYNPLFILEANFDGRPGPFWAQIEATMGEALRDMLRCCNPPRDRSAVLFNAVIRQKSRIPVAPLLEACTVLPAVYHQGNRGLDRMRIIDEGKLFDAIQNKLRNNPDVTQRSTATQIHQNLRRLLLSSFPWLDQPATPRVTRMEGIAAAHCASSSGDRKKTATLAKAGATSVTPGRSAASSFCRVVRTSPNDSPTRTIKAASPSATISMGTAESASRARFCKARSATDVR